MRYGLFGSFTAQPGKRDQLVGHLLQAATLLERDVNCLHYSVSSATEPDVVYVYEVWTDQATHDASLEAADIQALIRQATPTIASVSGQVLLTVHGGKGLST